MNKFFIVFYIKKYYRLITYIIGFIILAGCHFSTGNNHMNTLSKSETQKVAELIDDSSIRCFGVYLIDLPNKFIPSKEMEFLYEYNNKVKISTQQQYLPPFRQRIRLREQELKLTQAVKDNNNPFLKAIYPLQNSDVDNTHGLIFERMESVGMPDVARVLEGYRWQDDVTLKIEIEARNGSDEKYNQDRQNHPRIYQNNVTQQLNKLYKLFERIEVRGDLTIPSKPGVCLLYSFMPRVDDEWKEINYGYIHNNIDDFIINFSSDDYAPDYALLDKPEAYFTEYNGSTIYKGKREVNGLKLEEWIVKGQYFTNESNPLGEKEEGYIFTLGIHMTDPTPTTPKLILTMYYKSNPNDYNENEIMTIWREITNTIRIRPNAFD